MLRFLLLSCPAKAGHPVRRGFSKELPMSVVTGSPAFAGDDDCCRIAAVPNGVVGP
jgi:hypothetical protein